MAKKETKPSKKVEEVEERDDAEDEQDTEDEQEVPAAARPASAEERRARMRARRAEVAAEEHDDDHAHGDHGHGDHADEDEDEIDTSNDPTWWVPHAVLGAMVLIGVFGFFGAFNKVAEKLGYKGIPGLVASSEATAPAHPAEQPKSPEPQRPPMQMPMQDQGPVYGAKHLLVMYKGSMRAPENITRTKDEAKARAGAKFEDLVKEYSDEPGAGQRGGDLGKFPRGRMVGPFQDAVEKTKVGEVSDLVETPFGYHVILRTQ